MATSAMASNSSSSSSTNTAVIPPTLAFLVSNFNSLVNIKLDASNYLLWRTQVLNACRANGYIGFLEGTVFCPNLTITDSSNNIVVNPDYTLWTLIDNQLLSCLTASLSTTTLPHVLGLDHVSHVWRSLEQRFNSMSKSHIHELKSRLYNVSKTGSMDDYIDEVRNHAHRLEAVGHHVDDDDLVFHTLNGLPVEEFKTVKTAVRTKGEVTFEELTAILHSEEMQIHKQEASSSAAKVFVTTKHEASSSGELGTGSGTVSNLGNSSQFQMFHPQSGQGSYYPQPSQPQNRSSGYDNRARGRNTGYGSKTSCQICGKTNHTAYSCYQRQNLNFQPPPFVNTGSGRSNSQPWNGILQNSYGGYNGSDGSSPGFNNSQFGFSAIPNSQGGFFPFTGYGNAQGMSGLGFHGNAQGMTGMGFHGNTQGMSGMGFPSSMGYSGGFGAQPFVHPQFARASSSQLASSFHQPAVPASSAIGAPHTSTSSVPPTAFSAITTTATNPQWYFDSGASTHITNDLANLQLHQPCASGEGVVVGNGNSVPVTYSGSRL